MARRAAAAQAVPNGSDALRASSPAAGGYAASTDPNEGAHAASFSQADPSQDPVAEGEEGGIVKFIWGTTISLQESMNDFRNFLRNFKIKYRTAFNATAAQIAVDAGGTGPATTPLYDGVTASQGEEVLYERYLRILRETGQTNLNLDSANLLAFPPTKKLYHQLMNFPQEVIPIMDQVLRDTMIESAEEELERAQRKLSEGTLSELEFRVLEEETREIEGRVYKVRPYGGERSVNMRELNPGGQSGLCTLDPP